MYVMGAKGDQWSVDESLRERSAKLIDLFDNLIGHVILDQVIFMRLTGSKAKFHGICYYVGKPPLTVIPKYVAYKLNTFGLLNLTGASFTLDDMDIFDIRYIIAINDDSICEADGDIQQVEDITLVHEMMHISPDGDKLIPHDIKDFSPLVAKFGPYWGNGFISDEGAAEISQISNNNSPIISLPAFIPKSADGGDFGPDGSD